MKYQTIRNSEVFNEVLDCKKVFVIDRKGCNIFDVDDLSVFEFLKYLKIAMSENNNNQIEFYKEIKDDAV